MSPASQILTMFPTPPDLGAVATQDTIGLSLEPGHPTMLLDLTTGEVLPHWVELDAQAHSVERTLVFVRPIRRLEPDHHNPRRH